MLWRDVIAKSLEVAGSGWWVLERRVSNQRKFTLATDTIQKFYGLISLLYKSTPYQLILFQNLLRISIFVSFEISIKILFLDIG